MFSFYPNQLQLPIKDTTFWCIPPTEWVRAELATRSSDPTDVARRDDAVKDDWDTAKAKMMPAATAQNNNIRHVVYAFCLLVVLTLWSVNIQSFAIGDVVIATQIKSPAQIVSFCRTDDNQVCPY